MGVVIQKLRDSARGQACMFRIPMCCNNNPATTVFCHAPDESKGMGNKAHDFLGAFGCSECHRALDEHRGLLGERTREMYWLAAMRRTLTWWVEHGYIKIVGDNDDAKPRVRKLSKIVPHDGRMRR